MPNGMMGLDAALPELGDGKSVEEKLFEILGYQKALMENLKYLLSNLGVKNFNKTQLDTLTEPVRKSLSDMEGNMTEIAANAAGLSISVQSLAGNVQSLSFTLDGLTVSDGQGNTTINGNKIRSGTISGVTLISSNPASGTETVVIQDGEVGIGQGVFKFDGSKVWLMSNMAALKLESLLNLSISAGSGFTTYIGTDNNGENVTIGNAGGAVRLVGDVYINDVKQ